MEVRAEGRGVGNEGLRALVVALAETTSLLKTPRESALERNCVSYSAALRAPCDVTLAERLQYSCVHGIVVLHMSSLH